ncbi:hypothetical protein DFH08DRAFT_802242 [Mycena albidolilacea]|uniref:Uncharacterized protein n=1 Tax=Mycena albidolilacea TaxID=1033008 RepID=A0AAD7AI91_9AGAR|nr:hypothetical protein DFH08DRAFT_802242 [Mycena albidolilacea]
MPAVSHRLQRVHFDRTQLELTRQAPEFDLNNHLLRQVAIEADPGIYFIKKPTNAALNLLLDQEVLRDAVETLAQVEARLGHLEAVFRGDGDRKTCGCGWLNGEHTRQHWVSQGMVWPERAWQAPQHFGLPAPSTQRKPTVKTLVRYNRRRCHAGTTDPTRQSPRRQVGTNHTRGGVKWDCSQHVRARNGVRGVSTAHRVEPGDAESAYSPPRLTRSSPPLSSPKFHLHPLPHTPPRADASIISTRKNTTPVAPIPLDMLCKKIVFGDAIDRDDKEELEDAESHSHAGFTRELHHPRVLRTKGQHLHPLYIRRAWCSRYGARVELG